ncbi:uncharacterized protein LOC134840601 [Symsagittifera roscoffensis]|uniref:uncharacterized protein LOC134840601 n=1 Tax=Symsagittifera roscoffensis TaxID=84072 RepID=UPI00307B1663
MTAYCVMGEEPALTYVDIVANTRVHSATGPGEGFVDKHFQKGRIEFNRCLVAMKLTDTRFTSRSGTDMSLDDGVETAIGKGGTCSTIADNNGRSQIDLEDTRFQIPSWVSFEYRGQNPSQLQNVRSKQILDISG